MFCAIVVHAPSLVRCSTTSWPVEVSWYLRYPAFPCMCKCQLVQRGGDGKYVLCLQEASGRAEIRAGWVLGGTLDDAVRHHRGRK